MARPEGAAMGGRYRFAFPWQAPPAEHVDSYGEHVQVLIEERQELMWHHQLCQSNPKIPTGASLYRAIYIPPDGALSTQ